MTDFSHDDLLRLHGKALRHLEGKLDAGEATAADLAVLARLLSEMNVLAVMAIPKAAEPRPATAEDKSKILPFGPTDPDQAAPGYRN